MTIQYGQSVLGVRRKRHEALDVPAQRSEAVPVYLVARCNGARATVQHGLSAPILGPAGNIVTHSDRAFLAVRDRANPGPINTGSGQEVANGGRTACTQRDVILSRATLIRMTLDRDRKLWVLR